MAYSLGFRPQNSVTIQTLQGNGPVVTGDTLSERAASQVLN
jgi:hypothetical protein